MTREQKAEMYKLRQEGMTLKDLGKRYGVSRERIRQLVAKRENNLRGISNRLKRCVYPGIRYWMIVNEYTYQQFADECGVSMETIRNVLIGHTKPHQGTIEAILKKTGLSYEDAFRK